MTPLDPLLAQQVGHPFRIEHVGDDAHGHRPTDRPAQWGPGPPPPRDGRGPPGHEPCASRCSQRPRSPGPACLPPVLETPSMMKEKAGRPREMTVERPGSPIPTLGVRPHRADPRPGTGHRPHVEGRFLYVGADKLWVRGVTYGTFLPSVAGRRRLRRGGRGRGLRADGGVGHQRDPPVHGPALVAARPGAGARTLGVGRRPLGGAHHLPRAARRSGLDPGKDRRGRPPHRRTPRHPWRLRGQRDPIAHRALARGRTRRGLPGASWPTRPAQPIPGRSSPTSTTHRPSTCASGGSTTTRGTCTSNARRTSSGTSPDCRTSRSVARWSSRGARRATAVGSGRMRRPRLISSQVRATFAAGSSGTFVFAWTDEWARGGSPVDDWDFGIATRDRRPKPALGRRRGGLSRSAVFRRAGLAAHLRRGLFLQRRTRHRPVPGGAEPPGLS